MSNKSLYDSKKFIIKNNVADQEGNQRTLVFSSGAGQLRACRRYY